MNPVIVTGKKQQPSHFLLFGALLVSGGFLWAIFRFPFPTQTWGTFVTIFLSIFVEAFPFLLLGSIVAAGIHRFVSEEALQRLIPARGIGRYAAAGLVGLLFPVCECGIVPIMRSLIRKGIPPSVAVVFMAAAPVVNPLVGLSTYVAFNGDWQVVAARLGMAYAVAVLAGILLHRLGVDTGDPLLHPKSSEPVCCDHDHSQRGITGFLGLVSGELFQTGRFLVLGACLAALFQVAVPRVVMAGLQTKPVLGTGAMMGFAYLSSLCSEADAFVAAAFRGILPLGALLGFLVYGPMMDVKNTLMLLSGFKKGFVWKVVAVLTLAALAASVGFSLIR